MLPAAHNHLGVIDQEQREDESCQASPHTVQDIVVSCSIVYDQARQSKEEQDHAQGKQQAGTHREVNLGLNGKQGDGETDERGNPCTHHHTVSRVEAADGTDHIGEGQGKNSKTDQVAWVLPPHRWDADEHNVCHKEGSV